MSILNVTEGDAVTKDQILVELWNEDLKAEVLLAERDALADTYMASDPAPLGPAPISQSVSEVGLSFEDAYESNVASLESNHVAHDHVGDWDRSPSAAAERNG